MLKLKLNGLLNLLSKPFRENRFVGKNYGRTKLEYTVSNVEDFTNAEYCNFVFKR